MSRFIVTMLEGDLTMRSSSPNKPRGASFHVIDTAINHRLVAIFRTEEEFTAKGGRAPTVLARAKASAKAAECAAELEAACS